MRRRTSSTASRTSTVWPDWRCRTSPTSSSATASSSSSGSPATRWEGHLYGAEAHAASLERFDAHLGRLVSQYLQSRDVGDLVVGLNPPRIPLGVVTQGGHSGLIDTGLVVKVLARGPQVEPLREGGAAWLPDLYRDLPDIAFGYQPERERHEVGARYRLDDLMPSVRLSLSPAYRAGWTMDVAPNEWAVWSEQDVFASYLTRWWFGVGVGGGAAEEAQPLARFALQFDVGDARLDAEAFVRSTGWAVRLGASFQLDASWQLIWEAPAGVGVGWA